MATTISLPLINKEEDGRRLRRRLKKWHRYLTAWLLQVTLNRIRLEVSIKNILDDRPYVSCGLDSEITEPGFLEFSQFELINKVTFDTDSNQFTLIEPGVYLLQMGGTIQGGNLVAKLVSDDIGVDFMTIEGNKNPCFKCRSSVFTIDDDDQIAESLMVELANNNEEQCTVGTDFFFLLYKISEVANADPVDHL